jgi:P-type E1-E2 ATPase
MVGSGIAATYGILIKGAEVLQKIYQIDTIVFDKTGTLTSGRPHVRDIINIPTRFNLPQEQEQDFMLYMAYLIEK